MPRLTKTVVRPKIDQNERNQIASNLVEQLKQYYCQASERTLWNLAVSIEKQAFEHARTRDQYSSNLHSLSSNELEKAFQIYEEINGRGIRHGGAQNVVEFEMDGNLDGQGLTFSNFDKSSDFPDGKTSEQDTKERQKRARQRIITRHRKRVRTTPKLGRGFSQKPATLLTEANACTRAETNSTMPEQDLSAESRGRKRTRKDIRSSATDIIAWWSGLDESSISDISSSFFEDLPAKNSRIDEDCGNIETCLSSTESRILNFVDTE